MLWEQYEVFDQTVCRTPGPRKILHHLLCKNKTSKQTKKMQKKNLMPLEFVLPDLFAYKLETSPHYKDVSQS